MNWRDTITVGVRGVVFLGAAVKVHHQDRVPLTGPVMLVCNHLSNADPPIFVGTFPRHVAFMAKAELWENPFLNWLGIHHGDVLIHRGEADRQALRNAKKVLDDGGALAILPEGTRSKSGTMQKGHQGAALIAYRANAPILPAGIWGTERITSASDFLRRRRVHINYGEPFHLDPANRKNLPAATDEIMERIAALLPERYRGVYGSQPAESPPV